MHVAERVTVAHIPLDRFWVVCANGDSLWHVLFKQHLAPPRQLLRLKQLAITATTFGSRLGSTFASGQEENEGFA